MAHIEVKVGWMYGPPVPPDLFPQREILPIPGKAGLGEISSSRNWETQTEVFKASCPR